MGFAKSLSLASRGLKHKIIIVFSLTLSGIYLPYIEKVFNINKFLLLIILYVFSFITLILMGIIYDVVLRLWKEENVVMVERNPYAIDLFNERELQNMKINLLSNKTLYDLTRTNVLIYKKLGIEYDDLEEQLKTMKERIEILGEWNEAGRITRK